MASLDDYKAKQEELSLKMNAIYTEFASQPKERKTYGRAQAQLQKLEEYFNSIKSNHAKIIISAKNVDYEHEYFKSTPISDAEDYYYGKLR